MTNRLKTRYAVGAVLVAASSLAVYLLFGSHKSGGLYRATVLPSLGGTQTIAMAVNDRGQVVGIGGTKNGQGHAFLWDREHGPQDLGVAKGQFDINNAGQIVGSAPDPNGDRQAFLWEPGKGRTFLGTLGGRTSQAMAINNQGQIVGDSETSRGPRHAFLWDVTHGMRDLGTLGGTESQARAINDAGQIVGTTTDPNGRGQVFLWDPNDGMIATGLSRRDFPLNGINSGSWIVGVRTSLKQGSHMVLWRRETGARELFPLEYFVHADPALLDDANQVVFCEEKEIRLPWILRRFSRSRYCPCLWDPNHGRILLDPYVPAPKKSFRPMDISNEGWIVGIAIYGSKGSPRARAVLLEPVPERWAQLKKSHSGGEDR